MINQELDIGHAPKPKMFSFEHISSQLFSYFLPTWFKGELGFLGHILDNVHLSKESWIWPGHELYYEPSCEHCW